MTAKLAVIYFILYRKTDPFLDISVSLIIFPYTIKLEHSWQSKQGKGMYFAVTPETNSAKCLSYYIGNFTQIFYSY